VSSPQITLTANLQDFTGQEVGSPANPAKVSITLCGFGPSLPRVNGAAMIVRPGPVYIESKDGSFTTLLWGNDVITPAGTYYTVALLDGQGNVVQCAAYQLTGSGSHDLSTLPPIVGPGQGPLLLPGLKTWTQNVLVGASSYTLPVTPYAGAPFMLFRSGMLLSQGNPPYGSYALSGNTINFTDSGTQIGDTLYALFW
jgi:hypothetical protein